MISVEVKINGRLIETVHAVNTGRYDSDGRAQYDVYEDTKDTTASATIFHRRYLGALPLASRLLTLLQSIKESRHATARPGPK